MNAKVLKLGSLLEEEKVRGSNARCVACLAALESVITKYRVSADECLTRELYRGGIKPAVTYLSKRKKATPGVSNAVRHLEGVVASAPSQTDDDAGKRWIVDEIKRYVYERIVLAGISIAAHVAEKIREGDVVLTYGCSSLVATALLKAFDRKRFSVIVVDAHPRYEGRTLLRKLAKRGVSAQYVLINAASYAMEEATLVLLGASGVYSNGYLLSRVGTAVVALVAYDRGVPVVACCETYKIATNAKVDGVDREYYDLTPPRLITAVVTENGLAPIDMIISQTVRPFKNN